jgi:hypothetical protein
MDFTVTEFFVRTNGDWPQVEPPDGPLPGIPKRIVDSNLVSPDELYGFNACFGLGGDEDSKGKAGPNKHASTLNTLLNTGKTQRDTRHSGHHGSSATKPVNVAVVGNTHWKTFIGMERGLVGNHVQCTKERFVVTAGEACRRHDALPLDFVLPPDVPSRWTWLPLNGRLAKAFGCGDLYQQPALAAQILEECPAEENLEYARDMHVYVGPPGGYVMKLRDGVSIRVRYTGTEADLVTQYRISARWKLPPPTANLLKATERITKFFLKFPHLDIKFEQGAKEMLLIRFCLMFFCRSSTIGPLMSRQDTQSFGRACSISGGR